MQKVRSVSPAQHTALGWEVDDLRRAVSALAGRGAIFERFEGFAHNDLGVFTFPDGTQVAWFKDPDRGSPVPDAVWRLIHVFQYMLRALRPSQSDTLQPPKVPAKYPKGEG